MQLPGGLVLDRPVSFRHPGGGSRAGFIDLYKRGCFGLEAKPGSEAAEPTFLFEPPCRRGADIRGTAGYWIEVFADFSGIGKAYVPFPTRHVAWELASLAREVGRRHDADGSPVHCLMICRSQISHAAPQR